MNAAAWNGEDPYTRKHENLRAIAGGMSLNFFHFYIGAESPYKSMDEIFGQKKAIRIGMSPTGTSDEWVFRKVLAHYKTDYKMLEAAGFKFFRGSYAEQASQFKDRNVDSVFTFLAVPAAAVTEASVGRSLRVMNFPPPLLESLGKYGIGSGKIKPGTYPKAANAVEEVTTATAGSVIIANKGLPDEVAYRIASQVMARAVERGQPLLLDRVNTLVALQPLRRKRRMALKELATASRDQRASGGSTTYGGAEDPAAKPKCCVMSCSRASAASRNVVRRSALTNTESATVLVETTCRTDGSRVATADSVSRTATKRESPTVTGPRTTMARYSANGLGNASSIRLDARDDSVGRSGPPRTARTR